MSYKLITGVALLSVILIFVFAGDILYTKDPNKTNLKKIEHRPDEEYILGTDEVGRDIMARLIDGGKISLLVGVIASFFKICIALILSFISAFFEKFDSLIMRICDIFMCFPFYVLAISMSAFLGPSIKNIIIIIVFFSFAYQTRILRTEMKTLKDMEYIQILLVNKEKTYNILINHIIPNLKNTIAVLFTTSVAQGILMESSLSFFGLGVQEPQSSWGSMMSVALNVLNIQKKWWMWLPAGLLSVLLVYSINLIGEGLKYAEDK